jgi:hypothetical protein
MESFNPYEPPRDRAGYPGSDFGGKNAWRDGDYLVLVSDSIAPYRCLKCNKAESFCLRHQISHVPHSLFHPRFVNEKKVLEAERLLSLEVSLCSSCMWKLNFPSKINRNIYKFFDEHRLFCWIISTVIFILGAVNIFGFDHVLSLIERSILSSIINLAFLFGATFIASGVLLGRYVTMTELAVSISSIRNNANIIAIHLSPVSSSYLASLPELPAPISPKD